MVSATTTRARLCQQQEDPRHLGQAAERGTERWCRAAAMATDAMVIGDPPGPEASPILWPAASETVANTFDKSSRGALDHSRDVCRSRINHCARSPRPEYSEPDRNQTLDVLRVLTR